MSESLVSATHAASAAVGVGLLEWKTWRRLPRIRRGDAAAFLTTIAATLGHQHHRALTLGCSLHLIRHLAIKTAAAVPTLRLLKPRDMKFCQRRCLQDYVIRIHPWLS